MRSQPSALRGSRRPRVRSCPPYTYSDGQAAIELAAAAGLVLDPWQQDVLVDALACNPDDADRWAALEVGILVPRQNGKGAILEARELAGLYLFRERLITHTAHEFKTAREHFLRVKSLVTNTDDLRKQVRRVRESHGEEGIELLSGARLNFVARSKTSGRGFTGDVIVLDEAQELTDAMMDAMFPTISARTVAGNPQVWYAGSAGDITSYTWARIRERGHLGEPRLCFFEWSAPDASDLDDVAMWALANPGLDVRISEEFIAETERSAMSDMGFAKERLGIWPTESSERAIPAELWDAVCHAGLEATKERARIGLEVTPDHTMAALAAWGGGVGELVDHRAGIDWIVPRLEELHARYRITVALDGNGPAAFLENTLRERGITVNKLSNAEVYSACARMYTDIADRKVAIRASANLDDAVAAAEKKTVSGDRFVWYRDRADVTPFFALTLAYGPATPAPVAPRVINLADIEEDE